MNDTREIAKLAEEASELYQQHGSADTAALLLEKAGNMLLDSSTIDSLRLFQRAGEVALVRKMILRKTFLLKNFTTRNNFFRTKIISNKPLISSAKLLVFW